MITNGSCSIYSKSQPEWNRSWSGYGDCFSARDVIMKEVEKLEKLAGKKAPDDLEISFYKD